MLALGVVITTDGKQFWLKKQPDELAFAGIAWPTYIDHSLVAF